MLYVLQDQHFSVCAAPMRYPLTNCTLYLSRELLFDPLAIHTCACAHSKTGGGGDFGVEKVG